MKFNNNHTGARLHTRIFSNQKTKDMETIKFWTAANVTYSDDTFNTRLFVEYRHTGAQFFTGKNKYTENRSIAEKWKAQGKNVKEKAGYWYIDRIAIPTINAKGEKDIWYISNCGDYYRINKVSKYWQKIHKELSNNINPFLNQ